MTGATILITAAATWLLPAAAGQLPGAAAAGELPGAAAAAPAAAERGTAVPDTSPAALRSLWEARRRAADGTDPEAATAARQRLVEAKQRAGWPDATVAGEALAWESAGAGRAGDAQRGVALGAAAVALAPHSPRAHLALTQALWGNGERGAALRAALAGLRMVGAELPLWHSRLVAAALDVAQGAVAAALAFALVALVRQRTPLLHSLTHALPAAATPALAWAVVAALLGLPLLLQLGPLSCALVWLAAVAPFCRGADRGAAVAAALLLLVAGAALPWLARPLAFVGSRAEQLYRAGHDVDAVDAAAALQEAPAPDADVLAVLGMRALWSGEAPAAVALLAQAQAQPPTPAEVPLALAEAQARTGDVAAASRTLEQHLAAQPNDVLALFNLSQLYLSLADPRADALRERAAALDGAQVEQLTVEVEGRGQLLASPGPPTPAGGVAARLGAAVAPAELTASLWRWFAGPVPRGPALLAAVAVALWTAWVTGSGRRGRWARTCNHCGRAACPSCDPSLPSAMQVCQACQAAGAAGRPEPQRVLDQIAAHRHAHRSRALQRASNLLVVGSGHAFVGRPLTGMLLAAAFFAAAAALLRALHWAAELVPAYGPPLPSAWPLPLALVVLFYVQAAHGGRLQDD